MDRADVSLALALVEEVGADDTTVVTLAGDGALAMLETTTTGFGAGSPLGPGSSGAVNGAWALGTGFRLGEGGGTFFAAELGLSSNHTSAGMFAGTASLRASSPWRPGRNDAVDGAELGVALFGFEEARALVSSPERVDGDLTGAGHHAGTTFAGALGVLGPGGDFAVLGAGTTLAADDFFEHATGLASECGGLSDTAGAGTEALAAGDTALGERFPLSVLAVNGTGLGVALACLLVGVAFASVVSVADNLTDTNVLAGAAGLGAASPEAEARHDAVDLFGVSDVVDAPLVLLGEFGSLGVVEVHTESLGAGLVDGASASDHPVMRTALEGSYVGGGLGVETLGGVHVNVKGLLAAGGGVFHPVGATLTRGAGIFGADVGNGPLVELGEFGGESDGVYDIDTEALAGGLVDGVGASDFPVVSTTMDTGDVAGGVLEARLDSGHISVDYVLGVGDSLPASGAFGSAARGLASVGEPGEFPGVFHGEKLHEFATKDGVPDVYAEAFVGGLVHAVHAGELPVGGVTSNGGNVSGFASELASLGVHVHVKTGGAN